MNLADRAAEAWDESIQFLSEIAGGVVTVLVFAWWLPLVAIPAYWLASRLRRQPSRSEPPAQPAGA